MKLRATLILLAILIVLAAVFWGADRSRKDREDTGVNQLVPVFNVDEAEKMTITLIGTSVEVIKEGDGWTVTQRWRHPADEKKLTEFIEELQSMESLMIVSRNPEKQAKFKVDKKQGKLVEVSAAGKRNLVSLILGKPGSDYRSSYVRPVESNEVHQVKGMKLATLSAEPKAWLKKRLFSLEHEDVGGITMLRKDGLITLTKKNGTWSVEHPKKAGARLDKVDDLVDSLIKLECEDIESRFSEGETVPMTEEMTVAVITTDNRKFDIRIGESPTHHNRVTVSGKPYVYLVPAFRFRQCRVDPSEYIEEEVKVTVPDTEKSVSPPPVPDTSVSPLVEPPEVTPVSPDKLEPVPSSEDPPSDTPPTGEVKETAPSE